MTLYIEKASRTILGFVYCEVIKKNKNTYVPLKLIRHIGQLSRVEDPSLWFSIFSLQLSVPGILTRGGGFSADTYLASPNEIFPWCVCIWSSSLLFSFLFSLLFCTVPLQCCWKLKAFGELCDNVKWCVELPCWLSLHDLGLASSFEIPFASSPTIFLAWSVIVTQHVFSAVEGKLSLSALPCPLYKWSIWLCVSWWELRSFGFRCFSLQKDGNDTHWKSFFPIVKTSCFCRLSSSELYDTHTHSDFKQVQFYQYIKPRLNILQILRRLNYIEEKNILFTSISSACKAIKNFLEFMQYVSSLNISKLIQQGTFLICSTETKDENNNLLLFRKKISTLEGLCFLCYCLILSEQCNGCFCVINLSVNVCLFQFHSVREMLVLMSS